MEPLRDYVARRSQGLWEPVVHRAFFVVDGLNEVGTSRANSLMQEIRIYADANDKCGTGSTFGGPVATSWR